MPNIIRSHIPYPAKQAAPKVEVVPKPPKPKGIGWTSVQDEFLKAHFLTSTAISIAAKTSKTTGQVYARAYQLGLQKRLAGSVAQRERRAAV